MNYRKYIVKYETLWKNTKVIGKCEVTLSATSIYEAMGFVAFHLQHTDYYFQIISVVAEESEEI